MNTFAMKYSLALGALLATACASVPAMADQMISVSNVEMYGSGETCGAGTSCESNVVTSQGTIGWVGAIGFTTNPGLYPSNPVPVWCDDLNNNVFFGSSDTYYLSDANYYLSTDPGNTLANPDLVAQEIAGLAYYGDNNLGNAVLDAEIQMAMWEIEYPGLTAGAQSFDANFAANVSALIGSSYSDYVSMLLNGYLYAELESPSNGQTPGSIFYTDPNQTQGQIYIYPNPGGNGGGGGCGNSLIGCNVPEPGALGLLGSGLFLSGLFGSGLLGWRRRKSSKADQA